MKLSAHYDYYLTRLLRGDRAACEKIVREVLADGVPIKTLYTDLFRAALYQVGELWQSNRISVATEHLATAVTQSVMTQVVAPRLFGREPVGRSLVVSCAVNDFHQVGGRMVADIAETKGSVRDQGPGVPAAMMSQLFQPFARGPREPADGHASHGLGLAIAKRMVNAHGGRIWASNPPGGGATFFFTLPLKTSPETLAEKFT